MDDPAAAEAAAVGRRRGTRCADPNRASTPFSGRQRRCGSQNECLKTCRSTAWYAGFVTAESWQERKPNVDRATPPVHHGRNLDDGL